MPLDQPTTLCLELLDFAQKYKPYLLSKSMKSWLKLLLRYYFLSLSVSNWLLFLYWIIIPLFRNFNLWQVSSQLNITDYSQIWQFSFWQVLLKYPETAGLPLLWNLPGQNFRFRGPPMNWLIGQSFLSFYFGLGQLVSRPRHLT